MLSLYIHIPFCVGKCHYCAFYSTHYSKQSAESFIAGLRLEAQTHKSAFQDRVFDSVYIGGGTPTVLSREQLEDVMSIIRDNFAVSIEAEWTVEANPNTAFAPHFTFFKEKGVNRLSFGIQSFSDELLNLLGRLHTAQDAIKAFNMARSSGFNNISIDLIYGIPGQTINIWRETLKSARDLGPEHISAYSLSLDNGSRFKKGGDAGDFLLPDDDLTAEMYEICIDELHSAGYEHYEISNFARPGFACRHNMNYWERGECLGLGPGGSSFLKNRRYQTVADIDEYLRRLQTGKAMHQNEDLIDCREAANETVMLALRTRKGLDLGHYERIFGRDLARHLEKKTVAMKQRGLVEIDAGRLKLTQKGILLANEVLERLFL